MQLLNEVCTQCAAYTTVLQCYEGVVLLGYDTALLNEGGINVYLAQVVDDYCELYPLTVLQNSV